MPNGSPLEAVAKRMAGKLPKPRPATLRGINAVLKPRTEPAKPVKQPAAGGVRG
jgi:hypothetical protein